MSKLTSQGCQVAGPGGAGVLITLAYWSVMHITMLEMLDRLCGTTTG
jgi:hypothetical protein